MLSASRGTTSIDEGKLTQPKITKMSHQLSQADQEQYRRDGFFFPLRIFSAEEAADHREQLESLEAKHGPMHYRTKPYL